MIKARFEIYDPINDTIQKFYIYGTCKECNHFKEFFKEESSWTRFYPSKKGWATLQQTDYMIGTLMPLTLTKTGETVWVVDEDWADTVKESAKKDWSEIEGLIKEIEVIVKQAKTLSEDMRGSLQGVSKLFEYQELGITTSRVFVTIPLAYVQFLYLISKMENLNQAFCYNFSAYPGACRKLRRLLSTPKAWQGMPCALRRALKGHAIMPVVNKGLGRKDRDPMSELSLSDNPCSGKSIH